MGAEPVTGERDSQDVRPLALGYIREDEWMSEEDFARATCVLSEFADREGYALGTVYIERVERTPAAFEALLATAIRDEAAAIVVPGFEHLALIGSTQELAQHMAKTTGSHILTTDPAARDTAPDTTPAVAKVRPTLSGCEW